MGINLIFAGRNGKIADQQSTAEGWKISLPEVISAYFG
jgi:hypothetical protein